MGTLKIAIEDRLYSAETAAALLGIRPSTIRWYWTSGRLGRVKVGRLTRVRESELLALITTNEKDGNAPRRYIRA